MSAPVWAWGRLGHCVIARVAEKNLNPKAKAAIKLLLEEGESIAGRIDMGRREPWQAAENRSLALRRCSSGRAPLRFPVLG